MPLSCARMSTATSQTTTHVLPADNHELPQPSTPTADRAVIQPVTIHQSTVAEAAAVDPEELRSTLLGTWTGIYTEADEVEHDLYISQTKWLLHKLVGTKFSKTTKVLQ